MESQTMLFPLVTGIGAHNFSIFWYFIFMFGWFVASFLAFFEGLFKGFVHQDWVNQFLISKTYWDT